MLEPCGNNNVHALATSIMCGTMNIQVLLKSSSILETRDVYDDGAKLNPSLYSFKPDFNNYDHDDYDGDDDGEGTLACEAG